MRLAVDDQRRAEGIGTGLAHTGEVYRWCRFLRTTVAALIADGTRGTQVGDFHHACHRHGLGVNPWPLHIGEKDLGRTDDTEARMNAATALELQFDVGGTHGFDAID